MFNNYKDCNLNDKAILKSQQRYKSDCLNVYPEQINKIALSSNDDKRLQTVDTITTYPHGTNAFKVCESKFRRNSKIEMINFDDYANANKTEHSLNWPNVPDHPYKILIKGASGSGKTNALLNLIIKQPDIDKIYLHAKDPYEAKY